MASQVNAAGADLLETIVAATRRIVEVRQQREPLAALAKSSEAGAPRRGAFSAALGRLDRINIIAECKRRSPSRGAASAVRRGGDRETHAEVGGGFRC
jgi:indole-3-glycerol phosphate synthase